MAPLDQSSSKNPINIWQRLSAIERAALLLLAALLTVGFLFVILSQDEQNFAPLMATPLSSSDRYLAEHYLEIRAIPYQRTPHGQLLVPAPLVDELKAEMAALGLPHSLEEPEKSDLEIRHWSKPTPHERGASW